MGEYFNIYGNITEEQLNEWERRPEVIRVLTSKEMGAWLMRRDENKRKATLREREWARRADAEAMEERALYLGG